MWKDLGNGPQIDCRIRIRATFSFRLPMSVLVLPKFVESSIVFLFTNDDLFDKNLARDGDLQAPPEHFEGTKSVIGRLSREVS